MELERMETIKRINWNGSFAGNEEVKEDDKENDEGDELEMTLEKDKKKPETQKDNSIIVS
jgi:hypothetical protein